MGVIEIDVSLDRQARGCSHTLRRSGNSTFKGFGCYYPSRLANGIKTNCIFANQYRGGDHEEKRLGITGIVDLMESVGENFDRSAKLLGSKGWMQGEENLDHFNRAIGAFFNCTHPLRFSYSLVIIFRFTLMLFPKFEMTEECGCGLRWPVS